MKYIKKFELVRNNRLSPKLNDYVICKERIANNELAEFLSNNIGQIVDYNLDNDKYYFSKQNKYIVKFENIPPNLKSYFTEDNLRGYKADEISHNSRNKEVVEAYLVKK